MPPINPITTSPEGQELEILTLTQDKTLTTTPIDTPPPPSPPTTTTTTDPQLSWPKSNPLLRSALSEFFGTMILILFGNGVVAQVLLSHNQKGSYQSISWGWGLGVMLAIYVSTPSGSHLNPAITWTLCLLRHFPWSLLPLYTLSQLLGAMTGSAIVYANYRSAIDTYEGGASHRTVPGISPPSPPSPSPETATAGIFSTYPAPFLTLPGQFFSESLASAILMFMIFALKDERNLGAPAASPIGFGVGPLLFPLAMFFVVFGLGACFGWETGYAMNMARDFGPRLVAYMIGYGRGVWVAGGYYFWVPIVAPFFGCTVGGWLYDAFLYTGADSVVNTPYLGFQPVVGLFIRRRRRESSNLQSPV
ncbi:aquaporin-like protein [Aspergillus ellipticus CBS 707.79]|uniref:Aquaporin-like protein n=1 Tax=Aspergillus ellipticus CBS 707.79 TaxID=1448320 RepID=A0A319EFI2_9EURO|nr:aquaporin-like protein [Aspergillus ellipticus CBS 707.79]